MKVLIVGAGPAGLTTAVELAHRGIVSDVIDLRESGSGLSRAVGILPASLEILKPSGVTDKLPAEGMKFRQVRIYCHTSLALALPLKGSGEDDAFILASRKIARRHICETFYLNLVARSVMEPSWSIFARTRIK